MWIHLLHFPRGSWPGCFDTAWPWEQTAQEQLRWEEELRERETLCLGWDTLTWEMHLSLAQGTLQMCLALHLLYPACLADPSWYLPHHYRLAWTDLDSLTWLLHILLWDQPLVGEPLSGCHPWLPALLALWSSPIFLPLIKQSGPLESFAHLNFCLKLKKQTNQNKTKHAHLQNSTKKPHQKP